MKWIYEIEIKRKVNEKDRVLFCPLRVALRVQFELINIDAELRRVEKIEAEAAEISPLT